MPGPKPSVRLTFHGAAQTVTGSKFLLEVGSDKVLFDCGLFQGKKELRLRNWNKPKFDPRSLSAIVLTHAHIDHTGYLPLVVRSGYQGPIYCTPATAELLELLLPDSAHLQEEEARFANAHGTSKHSPAKPLYTAADVKQTLQQLKVIERGTPTEILNKISVLPLCAGHILGATSLTVDVHGRRITFSGDVGRYDVPILPDPCGADLGDVLLCESTYGNRLHAAADIETELAHIIKKAAEREGPIIIPAFAIGRTQNLLYYLGELERAGRIPVLPVYVDSPMAVDATKIYRQFKHDYDDEASELLSDGETPLLTANTTFCRKVEDSKRLNFMKGSRIIISASGMVTGGRILHHMKNWLDDESTTVLFVGYQAEGSRGRVIQSGSKEVRIFGQHVPINATIETVSGLSAHGDQSELLRWLKSCSGAPSITKIIHGEPEASAEFAGAVQATLGWEASPAEYLETIEF